MRSTPGLEGGEVGSKRIILGETPGNSFHWFTVTGTVMSSVK